MGELQDIMRKIKRHIGNIYYRPKAYFTFRYYMDNQFVKDLYFFCKNNAAAYHDFFRVMNRYNHKIEQINKLLYVKLNAEERNQFIRFLMKRYWNITTVEAEEIDKITKAFSTVKKMYDLKKTAEEPLVFKFRDKEIQFYNKENTNSYGTSEANMLMKYYAVTHAFYLTEYEKEGFNPENGQTILDCGAAYGDTMLLFHALYPDSKIYSFEFSEETYSFLNLNKERNGVNNAEIIKTFLYEDTGLHYLNKDYQISSEEKSGDEVNRQINTISIDDFVEKNQINNIGLIKFDIEGGEQKALLGAKNTILTQKPLLYIPIYHLPSDIYAIPEFIHDLGMKCEFGLKWTEKLVWGMDCVLFVRFVD